MYSASFDAIATLSLPSPIPRPVQKWL
jgi:hypothetical protein